jgi:hypothetical protein
MPSPETFFSGHPDGLAIYRAVAERVVAVGDSQIRVSQSQIAFRRRRGFAYVWRPGKYVTSSVPAVLSIALPRRLESARFKEVVHPAPTVWMHHLELRDPGEVDDQVAAWLHEAWNAAG